MAETLSLAKRWEDLRATKTAVFWSCAACIVGTMIVGFTWGGWVKGGTAHEMAIKAASDARAELAAAVCLHAFVNASDATTKLASLKGTDSWRRDTFIEEGGWATLPGESKPVAGAARLCAQLLMDGKLPVAKSAG
ncbi:MAG: hypothetical protein FJX35_15970 [Alphaproteobacteria bacterium]|nr:hypothetical protein [Alphaproteobacteria bacterium]